MADLGSSDRVTGIYPDLQRLNDCDQMSGRTVCVWTALSPETWYLLLPEIIKVVSS